MKFVVLITVSLFSFISMIKGETYYDPQELNVSVPNFPVNFGQLHRFSSVTRSSRQTKMNVHGKQNHRVAKKNTYSRMVKFTNWSAKAFCLSHCTRGIGVSEFSKKLSNGKVRIGYTCKSKNVDEFKNKLCFTMCKWGMKFCQNYKNEIDFPITNTSMQLYGLKEN